MSFFIESSSVNSVWRVLLRGFVLTLSLGTILFCLLPAMAVRWLPMAGIDIR